MQTSLAVGDLIQISDHTTITVLHPKRVGYEASFHVSTFNLALKDHLLKKILGNGEDLQDVFDGMTREPARIDFFLYPGRFFVIRDQADEVFRLYISKIKGLNFTVELSVLDAEYVEICDSGGNLKYTNADVGGFSGEGNPTISSDLHDTANMGHHWRYAAPVLGF